jgi:serine protease inhibitor
MKKYSLPLFLLILIACSKPTNSDAPVKELKPIELAGGGDQVVSASNEFGLDLFREISAHETIDKNLFISPTSISLALAMTWNGARTATADSMAFALRFPDLDTNEINAVYRDLMNGLTTVDEKVLLSIANSIWYRQDFVVESDFIAANQNYYKAKVAGLDFGDPSSKDIINGWVEEQTNGKIKDLIASIDNSYVMFLVNAIYFKGLWQIEFDKANTHDAPFILPDGSQKTVSMMYLDDTLSSFSNELFQAVELDYGRGNYSMVVLLPKAEKSVNDIINVLTPENWTNWMNGFNKTDLVLSLPRFKFEYDIQLKDALTAMGMGIAFSYAADFTGINKDGGLYIDYVRHKSFVEVNEEGTEAAAATVVAIKETAMLENIMYVNHPFIFAIREKSTGAVVFLGRVANPEE